MKIYVGYVLTDYATPACMGLNKKTVEKVLNTYHQRTKWIDEVELNGNKVVEFEDD